MICWAPLRHFSAILFAGAILSAASGGMAQPAAGTGGDPAAAIPDVGIARAALLVRMLGGDPLVRLEQSSFPADLAEPIRLDEAVAFALKNNFEIHASGAKTDAAAWDLAGAYAGYLPSLTLTRSNGLETSAPAAYYVGNNRVETSSHHRRDSQLSVRQPIVDVSLISDVLLRYRNKDAANAEELGTRERIAMQTISAYFKLVQSRLSMRFAKDYKDQLDKLNGLMGARVEGGGAPKSDLDRIRARSVSAQSAIIETASEFEASLTEFRRLTGVTPLQFQLPASLVPMPPASIDDALGMAMKANPDYLLSRHQVDAQEMESYKSYSRLLPKISFEYTKSRSWNADGAAMGGTTSTTDAIFPFQNETRAMVVATWSISGGTEVTQGLASAAKAREADFRSRDTRAKLEESVRVSFNALAAARGRVPVLEEAVESNQRVATAFEEQYLNASRPLFDLLDAYERQYMARQELTRVLVAEAQAGHQLRRLMGQLVGGLLETEIRAK